MRFKVYDLVYVHYHLKSRWSWLTFTGYGIPVSGLDFEVSGVNLFKAYLKLTGRGGIPVTPFRMCNPITGKLITQDKETYSEILLDDIEQEALDYFGSIPIITSFEYHILISNLDRLLGDHEVYRDLSKTRVDQQLSRYYDYVYAERTRAKVLLSNNVKKK